MKYKVSKNISITGFEEYVDENIPPQYKQGYYILNNKLGDNEFLINESIKYFIDKFSPPKTKDEVLESIKTDLKYRGDEIDKTCASFFDFLCKKKILLPEDDDEKILTTKPLFSIGDNNGDLTVEKILSEGQYIDVYLVYNKATTTRYIVKLLDKNKTLNPDIYKDELIDIEREFRLLDNIKHVPYICHAITLNKENEEFAYIVIEYFEGNSLSRFLRETEGATKQDCNKIIEKVLHAFSLLHNSKVVHGDIHTSNILINKNKDLKIIDMGLSHSLEWENNELLTFGGVSFYMPPERINISSIKKHKQRPDHYSDVYQIGIIMYFILYRKLPFDGFIWEDLSKNIIEADIKYPKNSFLNYQVPAEMIKIFRKCLSKNPEDRFINATDILEAYKSNGVLENEQLVNQ